MTIKEAILKVLEDNAGSFTYLEVLKMIDKKNYIDWANAKTPSDTVGAQLGHFIRNNDSRVGRNDPSGSEIPCFAKSKTLCIPSFLPTVKG